MGYFLIAEVRSLSMTASLLATLYHRLRNILRLDTRVYQ